MYNLDLKDRKILYELDTNSRQSYNAIAKKVGLSNDSIIYRIESMKRAGIIEQFHTILDVGKLGYISFRLYLRLHNTTPEKEKEIIEYLKKQKIVTWIVSIDGEFDLGMWILVKTIKEMNNFWKTLLRRYVNYIASRWLTIFTKVSYFTRAYLLGKEENEKEFVFITEPEEVKLDETDWKILKILAPDARISTLEIARKSGVTPKTAAARIHNLENQGVIAGYRTMFNLEKLGYQYFKVHFNLHDVTELEERRFSEYVKRHPNIIYDNEVLGGDDIEIEIQVLSLTDLRLILGDIKKQFYEIIRDYRYFLFYKEHKFLFIPV